MFTPPATIKKLLSTSPYTDRRSSSRTTRLKLGKAESAKLAFADIIKLDPNLELRNDIIEVSLKHCIYLEEFQQELTEEDLSFMTYVKDVEEAYQRWVEKINQQANLKVNLKANLKVSLNW